MFFHESGSLGYVLPKYSNCKYINIDKGSHFGLVDIVFSSLKDESFDIGNFLYHKDKMKRKFTVMGD